MQIKGQKITITEGESFTIPFLLVPREGSAVVEFNDNDEIFFVIQCCGDGHDIICKKVAPNGIHDFVVFVDKDETTTLRAGVYEYGVYLETGRNRIPLLAPTEFKVKRGVYGG